MVMGIGQRRHNQGVRKALAIVRSGVERDGPDQPVGVVQRRTMVDDRRVRPLQQAPGPNGVIYARTRFHSNAKPSCERRMKQPELGIKWVGNSNVRFSAAASSKCNRDRMPSAGSSSRLVPQRG